jgi:hypothetical protein
MPVADDEGQLDRTAPCLKLLQSENPQHQDQAERCCWACGDLAFEPLRAAASGHKDEKVRRRANVLRRSLLAASAQSMLKNVRAHSVYGTPVEWKLAVESDVVPYLRFYEYRDRYPSGVLLDLLEGDLINRIDESLYWQLFVRLSPPPLNEDPAAKYVKHYVRLKAEPYQAELIEVGARTIPHKFEVTVTYLRTTAWSPPGPGPDRAGSKTDRMTERWEVTPSGELALKDKRVTTERTSE